MDKHEYCCKKFEKNTIKDKDTMISAIEHCKGWHINGCCGGGCYVLTDILFCPFCGNKLKVNNG